MTGHSALNECQAKPAKRVGVGQCRGVPLIAPVIATTVPRPSAQMVEMFRQMVVRGLLREVLPESTVRTVQMRIVFVGKTRPQLGHRQVPRVQ